jgi:FkbM family methyltransferase
MKSFIKRILPDFILKSLKNFIWPASVEHKWAIHTKKVLSGKIKNEISIASSGDIYLKSGFGFDFLVDMDERHLKIDTFDDLKFKYFLGHLSARLPEEAVFLDIGAFMGGYSLAIAGYFPKSRIYSFEPVRSSFLNFIKNIVRNRFEKVITPFQLAISDKEGNVLMTSRQTTGNHILSKNERVNETETIPAIDLDTFLIKQQIEKVHFIKCDVEGHEMAVINGGMGMFVKQKPILYIEIVEKWASRYGNSPKEIINKITGIGYRGYELTQNSINEITDFDNAIGRCENFLFIADDI